MSIYDESLKFHEEKRGKIEVVSRVEVKNSVDLSLAYTPGVAAAYAIANSIGDSNLNEEHIMPKAFNKDVQIQVAKAVKESAIKSGVARI